MKPSAFCCSAASRSLHHASIGWIRRALFSAFYPNLRTFMIPHQDFNSLYRLTGDRFLCFKNLTPYSLNHSKRVHKPRLLVCQPPLSKHNIEFCSIYVLLFWFITIERESSQPIEASEAGLISNSAAISGLHASSRRMYEY